MWRDEIEKLLEEYRERLEICLEKGRETNEQNICNLYAKEFSIYEKVIKDLINVLEETEYEKI